MRLAARMSGLEDEIVVSCGLTQIIGLPELACVTTIIQSSNFFFNYIYIGESVCVRGCVRVHVHMHINVAA